MNRPAKSAKEVCKLIGCPFLNLYRGEGYWYFVFDDVAGARYDSESVYCMRLNDMDLARWVAIGKAFAATMEA